MAERAYTEKSLGGGVKKITWSGLTKASDDVGQWYQLESTGPRYGDKTVHVYGTFGTAGKLKMQGSNRDTPTDDTNFTILDSANADMEFTVVAGKVAMQNPQFIRPSITAGDANTNLSCEMIIRR